MDGLDLSTKENLGKLLYNICKLLNISHMDKSRIALTNYLTPDRFVRITANSSPEICGTVVRFIGDVLTSSKDPVSNSVLSDIMQDPSSNNFTWVRYIR